LPRHSVHVAVVL